MCLYSFSSPDHFPDPTSSSNPSLLFSLYTDFNFLQGAEKESGEYIAVLSKSPGPGHNSSKLITYSAFIKSAFITFWWYSISSYMYG